MVMHEDERIENGHHDVVDRAGEHLGFGGRHDVDAERSIAGAVVLAGRNGVEQLRSTGLEPAHVLDPTSRAVIGAAYDLADRHTDEHPVTVDIITLADELGDAVTALQAPGSDGITSHGRAALVALAAACTSTSGAAHHARIVVDHAHQRALGYALVEAAEAHRLGDQHRLDAALERTRITPAAAALAFEDVAAAVRGDVDDIRPTILRRHDGSALMYPGLTHWLMGEPGKGKTWVALHVAAEQLLDGADVLYLDWEGNRRIIGARLRALGVDADTVAQHLYYLRPPVLDRNLTSRIAAVATHCSVAIYDGVAKAIARQGLNEDKAPDVLAWLELLANPISEAGAAGLLLDHVTKEREGRGLWARGSGAKLGEVSGAAWLVKPKQGFSRNAGGRIDLVQAKDREGYIAADGATVANIGFMPDPEAGTLTITVRAPAEHTDDSRTFRPTGIMEKVSRTVERFAESSIEPGVNQIDNDLPGTRREWIGAAIACLVDEGFLARKPGAGKKVHHASIKPYRELDDPLSDRYSNDTNDAKEERWNDL